MYQVCFIPPLPIHLLIEPVQELSLNLLYPLDLLNYCNNGQKVEEYQTLFKKEILRELELIVRKIMQTDKIIKIIWENIYPINQYKEIVRAEKLRSKINP